MGGVTSVTVRRGSVRWVGQIQYENVPCLSREVSDFTRWDSLVALYHHSQIQRCVYYDLSFYPFRRLHPVKNVAGSYRLNL